MLIEWDPRALKDLRKLERDIQRAVVEAVESLAMNPRPPGCKKLVGRDGWRLRVRDYRVLYDVYDDRLVVYVVHVGHRRDIYDR
ncbi:MAG: type II toxin-antitoxin system RelE/ParE family toxin [Deltaproteobacteria bacterium]|nr:type II toxin-antitoxin system RelE/ParE family toxin [Deltaproteobacteria bacterium]